MSEPRHVRRCVGCWVVYPVDLFIKGRFLPRCILCVLRGQRPRHDHGAQARFDRAMAVRREVHRVN